MSSPRPAGTVYARSLFVLELERLGDRPAALDVEFREALAAALAEIEADS